MRLSRGETAVADLAKPFPISAPAISRHLRVLEGAHLIRRRKNGRVHLIRARREGLKQAQDWMARVAAGWSFSFDTLDRLLKSEEEQ